MTNFEEAEALSLEVAKGFKAALREFQDFSQMGQVQAERYLVVPLLKARITIRIESDNFAGVDDENL